jgi:hypothetical protein
MPQLTGEPNKPQPQAARAKKITQRGSKGSMSEITTPQPATAASAAAMTKRNLATVNNPGSATRNPIPGRTAPDASKRRGR